MKIIFIVHFVKLTKYRMDYTLRSSHQDDGQKHIWTSNSESEWRSYILKKYSDIESSNDQNVDKPRKI